MRGVDRGDQLICHMFRLQPAELLVGKGSPASWSPKKY